MAILDEDELQDLYHWVDSIPLSRPKRNIARDFSDGMLVAEVVKHFFPKLVELHNYPAAHATVQKTYNWDTLNQKVFKKLNFEVDVEEIRGISSCQPGSIERFLRALQTKIQQIQQKKVQRQHQQQTGVGGSPPSHMDPSHGHHPPPQQIHQHASHQQQPSQQNIQQQIIQEKDEMITEMKETIEILEMKVHKLEQLLHLKDSKIQSQAAKLAHHGIK